MRARRIVGVGLAAVLGLACQQTKSANPLSPDIAGPIPGVTISAPKPLEPFAGQTMESTQQPLTFLIENSSTTGVRPLYLQFQLAADEGFQQVLHTADRLTPGDGGRTSYRLTQTLGAGGTYYWRSRALDGANTGPYSAARSFSLTEPVVIETPIPVQPAGQITTVTPPFVVQNGRISGPAGPVQYFIEVATAADPGAIALRMQVTPGSNGTTSISAGSPAPYGTILYWRTYATNFTIQSPPSPWVGFRTPDAPTPGGGGGGTGGGGGGGGPVGPARTISIDEALQIIINVHNTLGIDLGSRSTRDSRIAFLNSAAATIHYGHSRFNAKGPDSNWCVKDAGGGRPQSDDVLVRCNSRDAWDLVGGAGADGYQFHIDPIGVLPSSQNVYPPPRSALP